MRRILIISSIFFVLFIYGLILSQTRVAIIKEELEPKNAPGFYDYHGTSNVHSDRNLGSGTSTEIIKAAQEAGLDFLFFTDLNNFNPDFTVEGYHRKLLVTVAGEYSYLDSRVLFYDNSEKARFESGGQTQVLLADLLSQADRQKGETLLVLAHPFKPGYAWSGAYPPGLDGLEIINLKSVWQKAWNSSKISFLWSALIYPFNSQLALLRLYDEPSEELALWDRLSTDRATVGFAGSDATAKTGSMGDFYFKFPAYQVSFSLLSNHVLLRSELIGEAERDRKKLFEALADGQFYFSLDLLGNPKGFTAYIKDRDKIQPIGSKLKWNAGMKLVVHLPQKPLVPFETAFFKDGEHVMSSNSLDTEYELHGPGVYRVVVRVFPTLTLPDGQRWISWIYTNPFYLK